MKMCFIEEEVLVNEMASGRAPVYEMGLVVPVLEMVLAVPVQVVSAKTSEMVLVAAALVNHLPMVVSVDPRRVQEVSEVACFIDIFFVLSHFVEIPRNYYLPQSATDSYLFLFHWQLLSPML